MNEQRTYIAIDLKSFYASVECVDRGLNSLTTNLVVADRSRTEKTICLAVSPSLKAYGDVVRNEFEHTIFMEDGTIIPLHSTLDLDSEIFNFMDY